VSYQLSSNANSAHLAHFWGKWAGLALLYRWLLQNGPQDFDFFNCHVCRLFICRVKNIEIWVPAFFNHNNYCNNNSSVATVYGRVINRAVKLSATDADCWI
jgi:hypothetical protein